MLLFFGSQAIRLLRESWDGVLRAKPDGQIVPHGANDLAQELFAMFDDDIPQTQNGPVTINQTGGDIPLTINNSNGGGGIDMNGGNLTFNNGGPNQEGPIGGITIGDGGSFNITNGSSTINGGSFDFNGGTTTINGGAFNFNGSAISFDDKTTVTGGQLGGSGGTTSVFLGKVVSGSENSYQVGLYGNGSSLPATATVTATVPQIASGETIPSGTWIGAVHKLTVKHPLSDPVTTYEFQPPIWLS